jgi:hypothetical protein
VCHEKDLTEKIRSPWEWLQNAELVGNITRNGVTFDLWQYKTGGTPRPSPVVVAVVMASTTNVLSLTCAHGDV